MKKLQLDINLLNTLLRKKVGFKVKSEKNKVGGVGIEYFYKFSHFLGQTSGLDYLPDNISEVFTFNEKVKNKHNKFQRR